MVAKVLVLALPDGLIGLGLLALVFPFRLIYGDRRLLDVPIGLLLDGKEDVLVLVS